MSKASPGALLAGARAAASLPSVALGRGFVLRWFLRVGNMAAINCVILGCHLECLFRPSFRP